MYADEETTYTAFITDEILEQLPERINKNDLNYGFRLWFVDNTDKIRHYCCNYFVLNFGKDGRLINKQFIIEQTGADACALMWIYLKKEGLL